MDFEPFRKSMFKAFEDADRNRRTQERALPVLKEAITEVSKSLSVSGKILPKTRDALNRALEHIEVLEAAHKAEKAAIAQAGAATGHLSETSEEIKTHAHDMANLATLSQYFEVASKWSPEFWTSILEIVEPDVLQGGFEGLEAKRLAEVAATVAEVAAKMAAVAAKAAKTADGN